MRESDEARGLPTPTLLGRIHLEALVFEGRHGWYAAERRRSRPFTVDLTVEVDLEAASRSDRLRDTLDYNRLAESVQVVVEGPSFRLIERLAGAIAEAVLDAHPVAAVEVTVRKPSPGVVGSPTHAAVTLQRRRPREG